MKLAIVTELFPPSIGGQEIRFEELGITCVGRGVAVDVYTIRHDLQSAKEEDRGGVKVHRITDCARYKSRRTRRSLPGIFAFTMRLWSLRRELAVYDAIIFNVWPILPALVLGPYLKGKAIVDICETRSGRFWHFIYGRLGRIPGVRFLGVSPEIVRHMKRVYGVPDERIHVAVSGVDLASIPLSNDSKDPQQILFFGRLVEHKNPIMLAEAFMKSTLPEKGIRLVIAGGGPLLEKIRHAYKTPAIEILGRVSDEEKWRLLSRSAMLVLPSLREGFPRVVAEGACVGTPVLTLDYVDNGTRFVVQDYEIGHSVPATEAALIAALEHFAADPQAYVAQGKAFCQRCCDAFGWVPVTTRLLAFLARG